MTTRPDGPRRQPLVDEDDWFAASPLEPEEVASEEVAWQDEPEPPPPADPELGRRQVLVVLAVIVAVALGAAGILVARSLTSDDTPTTPTTAATTEAATTTASTETTPTTTASTDTTPTTTTPTTPSSTTPSSDLIPTGTTLRPGDEGASVTALQEALIAIGFQPGTADGKYGASTTAAVTAFQQANGLTEDGIAGPATIEAINGLASG